MMRSAPRPRTTFWNISRAMLETPFRQELEESGQIIPLVFRSFEVELKAMVPGDCPGYD